MLSLLVEHNERLVDAAGQLARWSCRVFTIGTFARQTVLRRL